MDYFLYHCPACAGCRHAHELYVKLSDEQRSRLRRIRYQCPESGSILGIKVTGAPRRAGEIETGWIEALPLDGNP